jgi:hypothetical protein
MIVILPSHPASTGLNYRHIMTGSALSSISEGKCTKLKNTITHYVGRAYALMMMWATNRTYVSSVFSCLSGNQLLTWNRCSRKLRSRCSCQFAWCALTLRPGAHQGKWQLKRKHDFREVLSAWVEHMLICGAAHIEETETQLAGRLRNPISRQRSMPVFKRLSCRVDS